jgi:hypothetical protein
MRQIGDVRRETVREAFDLGTLTPEDTKGILMELSAKTLHHWMDYFILKEAYELCQVIKEVLATKEGHILMC